MKEQTKTVQDVREFNRFYTRLIGLLDGHLLNSEYSLAEARILYEIYIAKRISASQIMSVLDIDKGYLSRILKKFDKNGLITKQQLIEDARVSLLALSEKGLKVFFVLNQASNDQIEVLIKPLPLSTQRELVAHMRAIRHILEGQD
jgi:DNA-binding MarR family transcriptional regulator